MMVDGKAARADAGSALVRRWKTLSTTGSPVMVGNEIARQYAVLHPEVRDMSALVRRMAADVGLHLRSRSLSFEDVLAAATDPADDPKIVDAADEQAVLSALAQLLDDRDVSRDAVFGAAKEDVRGLVGTERLGINL